MRIKRTDKIDYNSLPLEIVSLLESMIVRTRQIIILRGLLATFAVAIIVTLLMMAIDSSTVIESNYLRWTLTSIVLLVVMISAIKTIFLPLRKEITLIDIARLIEINNPQLEERISSAIQLVSEKNNSLNCDSEILISDLIRKARVDINTIVPKNELTLKSVTPHIIISAIIVPLLIIIFSLWPYEATLTFMRTLLPSSNLGNIYAEDLVVTPGDVELKSGESLFISIITKDTTTERVEFRRIASDGSELVERMRLINESEKSKEFGLEIPMVDKSFSYRIMAKKALTKYYRVKVYQLPEIKSVTIRTIPPKYTGIEPYIQQNTEYLNALYGSELVFDFEFTKPVLANLSIHKHYIGLTTDKTTFVTKKQWKVLLTKELGYPLETWKIVLTDTDGNSNDGKEFPLAVSVDTPPTINISFPLKHQLTLNSSDSFTIKYYAYDDFSILDPVMVITDNGNEIYREKLEPPVLRKKNIWQGSVELNLNRLNLNHTKQLSVTIFVRDNFPKEFGGQHRTSSEAIVVNIDNNALSLAQQTINGQQKKIKEMLSNTIVKLLPISVLLQNSAHMEKKDITPEYIQKNFSKKRDDLVEVATTLASLSKQLFTTEFKTIARDIEYVRKDTLSSATHGMELMLLSDPIDYPLYLREVGKEVDSTIAGLRKILHAVDRLAEKVKELAELESIANQQSALAKSTNAIDSKKQLNLWKAKQNKVIKRLATLLRNNEKERKKDMINDLDTLNSLISIAKSLKARLDSGTGNDLDLKKEAKNLIIESVTLATKIEYVHQPSQITKMVKLAAIRLNKKLSSQSVSLLEDALNSLRNLINKKAKRLNFDQTNMCKTGMSDALKKAIKTRMASNKRQANNLARDTVKSLDSFKKVLTGGIGLNVGLPQNCVGNADAFLDVQFGKSSTDWTKIKGQLNTRFIKADGDSVPKEYKKLVDKYFEELNKQ